MTNKNHEKLIELTREYLIEKYGVYFLNLNERAQNDMIFATLRKALSDKKARN